MPSAGLLYNVEVTEDRIKHHGNLLISFADTFVFVVTVLDEFSPMNCLLLYPVNFHSKITPDGFKSNLRNMKFFLLTGNSQCFQNTTFAL